MLATISFLSVHEKKKKTFTFLKKDLMQPYWVAKSKHKYGLYICKIRLYTLPT